MDEDEADLVWDGYDEGRLDARSVAGLRLADAVVFDPLSLTPEIREDLLREFEAEGIAELALSVGMFMSMSKVLIAFGLEPVEMETTVMHAPVMTVADDA